MAKQDIDWKTRPLDADYLFDSGLLFEINRTTLHLLGLAMTVLTDPQTGRKRIGLKDCRANPEQTVFDKSSMEMGRMKLHNFMESFGSKQLNKRRNKLGWGCQPCGIAK